MAEQVPTPSTALDKLQEQLICPICLSQFDSPKTLPCLHSFCLKCILQLQVDLEKGKHVISCPTCRKTAQVPNKGPADLPTAFVINSLVEIQEQLKKVSVKGKQIPCDNCLEDAMTVNNPDLLQPEEESHKNVTFSDHCIVKVSCPTSSMAGRKVTATLSLQTKLGSPYKIPPSLPLTCHLISDDTSQAIVCDIMKTEVGKYSVSFTPLARGKHRLKIQVGGININGSPFSLDVVPSPEMRGKPTKNISGLNGPCGVAVDKKVQLIVAENGNHCITVYDKEGKKVRSLGTKEGQFTYPRGVAITNDGHILVTDNHRLQKLTPEGHCVMSVGSSEGGSGPLQFSYPRGISVHPTTGQIFVADEYNHRIQVINGDFTYSHSIGSKGTAPGQLNHPWDVALDCVGNVYYVANCWNNSIDVFTSDGKYLRQFGSRGVHLNRPSSITIDTHNMVYVAEWSNHRISAFTTDGVFIRHIGHQGSGEGEFKYPHGITVDMLGNLYVSDSGSNRVFIL